ncbi:MAG: cytochrome b/b6 domain-containing protein [Pacificimonas sp.]
MEIATIASDRTAPEAPSDTDSLIKRHRISTRLWHWTNVIAVFMLIGSGLTIFNAHPRLYWGEYGANYDPAWLEIDDEDGRGYVRVGSLDITTTGVLGVFEKDGDTRTRAFPHWVTIPANYSLAEGRRYHFLGAWIFGLAGLAYVIVSLFNRHIKRDLIPSREEWRWSNIRHDIVQHLKFNFEHSPLEKYNFLQKLSYGGIVLVVLPVIVLTGLTMSPNMNAAWPWLLDIFGGRQSARSFHFIAAFLLIGFIALHVGLVLLSGPWNQIRSMVTGRFRYPKETGT